MARRLRTYRRRPGLMARPRARESPLVRGVRAATIRLFRWSTLIGAGIRLVVLGLISFKLTTLLIRATRARSSCCITLTHLCRPLARGLQTLWSSTSATFTIVASGPCKLRTRRSTRRRCIVLMGDCDLVS